MPFDPWDWRNCHGWAYDICGMPASYVVREESLTTAYWSMLALCLKHARMVIDAAGTETDEYLRTWVSVHEYAKHPEMFDL